PSAAARANTSYDSSHIRRPNRGCRRHTCVAAHARCGSAAVTTTSHSLMPLFLLLKPSFVALTIKSLLVFKSPEGPEVVRKVVVRDVVVWHREITLDAPVRPPRVADEYALS